MTRWLLRAIAPLSLALVMGCTGPGFCLQAARGQMEIWWRSQSVESLQNAPTSPARLLAQLELAGRIRRFASDALGLPENGSYRRYADLGRPFVVWNVFATAPFSVELLQQCFAVAGCVSSQGYFSEVAARAEAAHQRNQGRDVHVVGIPAYSTLGWFDDPLLNTFIHYPELELARLIFHELAHQVVYIPGDTEFNESFAVAVETEGLQRWVAQRREPELARKFLAAQMYRDGFTHLVLDYRERLRMAYTHGPDDSARAAAKEHLIKALAADYRLLRDGPWQGYAGYDRWFGQEINNATLASIGLYNKFVPAFSALLQQVDSNLPHFYARVRALGQATPAARRAALAQVPAPVAQQAPPPGP